MPQGPFGLYVPDKLAVKVVVESGGAAEAFPYWAKLWPSGIALAAFIQQNPRFVAEKKVAELAAGVGLPSLVAATFATQVWCSDISEQAMVVAAKSAKLHQIKNIQFEACSWNNLPADFYADVVLLSDINYDPSEFDDLDWVLIDLLHKGCTLLLSTPQRLLAKPFLEKLSCFITGSHEERVEADEQLTYVSIFVLGSPKG